MKHTSIFLITCAIAGVASASPDDTAESAYKHGQAAIKAGRIHEACEAFAKSEQLAANVDTELGLASCYEQDGKPVSAARMYRSAADKDVNAERKRTSTAKAAKLEARAPKLRFAINPNPPGLVIKVDGVEVSATEDALVDTGPHDVIATAPGYEGHASAPVDREGAVVDVIVRLEAREQPAALAAPAEPAPAGAVPAAALAPMPAAERDEPAPDHRKRNGVILGAAGLGVLVGAGVVFAASSSKFDDEHKLCPMSKCANDMDLAKAHSILSDGHTLRGVSIGMGIGGALLLAAGGYLWFTPHEDHARVSFHVDPQGAGVAYTARF